MDLEDWVLLPKDPYKDLDHEEGHEAATKIIRNTQKSFDMDYFICPTQDPVGKTEFHRMSSVVPTQLLQVPITWEPVYTMEDVDHKKNLEPDPELLTDSDPSPRITFKTAKENEFVDMKIDLPARFTSPLPQNDEKHFDSEGVLVKECYDEMGTKVEEGGDVRSKKGVDWAEKNICGGKMNLWKMSLNGIGAICSFGVATAVTTFCVFFLGHNNSMKGCRNKNKIISFRVYTDDNKVILLIIKILNPNQNSQSNQMNLFFLNQTNLRLVLLVGPC